MEKTRTTYYVVARSIGRNPDNPSDRRVGIHTEQRLEINWNQMTNTITSVSKDNYVLEDSMKRYRIRKLTENECFKLQGFTAADA